MSASAARPAPAAGRAFHGLTAALSAVSAWATIAWGASMSAPGGMAMPGAWTPSMAWMRMPGQTWAGAAASFVGMWVVMMVAMMLPVVAPTLGRREHAAVAGAGYFAVWAAAGLVVYPSGVAIAAVAMEHTPVARALPLASGVAVLLAGAWQRTAWKARHLAACDAASPTDPAPGAGVGAAWRHGVRLGVRCGRACANWTVVLLALGVMDPRVMAMVGVAIAVERRAPGGRRAARAVGAVVAAGGALLVARAVGVA